MLTPLQSSASPPPPGSGILNAGVTSSPQSGPDFRGMIAEHAEPNGWPQPNTLDSTDPANRSTNGGLFRGSSQSNTIVQNLVWLFGNTNPSVASETGSEREPTASVAQACGESVEEDALDHAAESEIGLDEVFVLPAPLASIFTIALPEESSPSGDSDDLREVNASEDGDIAVAGGADVESDTQQTVVEVLPTIKSTVSTATQPPALSVSASSNQERSDSMSEGELSSLVSKASVFRQSDSALLPRQSLLSVQSESNSAVAWLDAFSLRITSDVENPLAKGLTLPVDESLNALNSAQYPAVSIPLQESLLVADSPGETGNQGQFPVKAPDPNGQSSDPGGHESSSFGQTGGESYAGQEEVPLEIAKERSLDASSKVPDNFKDVSRTNSQVDGKPVNNPTVVVQLDRGPAEPAATPVPPETPATPWQARVWDSVRFDPGPSRSFAPIREIDLRFPVDTHMVDVQLRERAGQLDVSVRTGDAALAREMQAGLGELVRSLESQGYRAAPRGLGDGASFGGVENSHRASPDHNPKDSSSRDGTNGRDSSGGQERQHNKRSRNGNSTDEAFRIDDTNSQGGSSV